MIIKLALTQKHRHTDACGVYKCARLCCHPARALTSVKIEPIQVKNLPRLLSSPLCAKTGVRGPAARRYGYAIVAEDVFIVSLFLFSEGLLIRAGWIVAQPSIDTG